MTQAGAEVLPEGCSCTGIIGRKEQRQHEEETADAGGAHQNSQEKRSANGEFRVGNQKSNRRSVREHEAAKHRRHERVDTTLKKSVNPILETAVKSELRAKYFALPEDQEENTDANAQNRESAGVPIDSGQWVLWHRE